MLTHGDDYPIHQTPEPIAFSGTDRNFYDRYFFNGYVPDGSLFFAVAFGVYPHLNIADAHFSVRIGMVEHCIHASRHLAMERLDLQVGPIRIVVEKPLQRLRVIVTAEQGIEADVLFEGRAFPIEEPRFAFRIGPRTLFDYTRLTQNSRCSGWITIDGVRRDLPSDAVGTRDRSWGVRPIGASDPQPYVPAVELSHYWRWIPLHSAQKSIFFHVNADSSGCVWNSRAAIVPDGAGTADIVEIVDVELETPMQPGSRYAVSGSLHLRPNGQPPIRIAIEPCKPNFLMRGIGYFSAAWSHGAHKGVLAVEREDIQLDTIDVKRLDNFHIQAFSRVRLEQEGHPSEEGMGVFEQLILGPYAPLGLKTLDDPYVG